MLLHLWVFFSQQSAVIIIIITSRTFPSSLFIFALLHGVTFASAWCHRKTQVSTHKTGSNRLTALYCFFSRQTKAVLIHPIPLGPGCVFSFKNPTTRTVCLCCVYTTTVRAPLLFWFNTSHRTRVHSTAQYHNSTALIIMGVLLLKTSLL